MQKGNKGQRLILIFQEAGQRLNLSIRKYRAQEWASEVNRLCTEHCQRVAGFKRPSRQTFQSAAVEEFGPSGPGSTPIGERVCLHLNTSIAQVVKQ